MRSSNLVGISTYMETSRILEIITNAKYYVHYVLKHFNKQLLE